MKTALVLGCSHAAGTELGTEEFGRQHSFPVLVAQSLGYTVTNLAQPGSSNDSMFRKFLESAQGFDLVLTAWTGVSRSEIYWDNQWHPLLHSRPLTDMSYYEKMSREILRFQELLKIDDAEKYNVDEAVDLFLGYISERFGRIVATGVVENLDYNFNHMMLTNSHKYKYRVN